MTITHLHRLNSMFLSPLPRVQRNFIRKNLLSLFLGSIFLLMAFTVPQTGLEIIFWYVEPAWKCWSCGYHHIGYMLFCNPVLDAGFLYLLL